MNQSLETRDEVIRQVYTVRESYAARFNYDLAALFRHAREQTKQANRAVVSRPPKRVENDTATV